jgi:hypothetical protein
VVDFIEGGAVRPGESKGARIHASSGQHDLSNFPCSTALGEVAEESGADSNVVGSVVVPRVLFFRQLKRGHSFRSGQH